MRPVLIFGVLALFLLHQDIWFWRDDRLISGFLPVGLAYHVAYTLVVFIWMVLLVTFAWPRDLVDGQPAPGERDSEPKGAEPV